MTRPPARRVCGRGRSLVISGYLITANLVRELSREGTVCLPRFYAGRARRLLPAASLNLLCTAALTYIALPNTMLAQTAWGVLAAAGYVENVALIKTSAMC
jgi:peptidoglycan/LPS O-acetylase OafA/YrhL